MYREPGSTAKASGNLGGSDAGLGLVHDPTHRSLFPAQPVADPRRAEPNDGNEGLAVWQPRRPNAFVGIGMIRALRPRQAETRLINSNTGNQVPLLERIQF